ncbi:chain length determinant protein tyrosine kinase EpsG [Paludibacterium yongneupense]|uniref:chain length determinant protein tyrosine kinase EpsG n=1 Tax=Paludibacterium yongneupense TaxID=400061 RepID=UPI0003FD77BF|nr:chain length determinant protein tyrosine kinase EpsG [Paludibacterium yongneupense]
MKTEPIVKDMTDTRTSTVGQLLLDRGKLTLAQAEKALLLQKEENLRFGEAAIKLGFITSQDLQEVLSEQFDYPFLPGDDESLSPQLIAAYKPQSAQVEALRSLRSQLMLRWISLGNKVFSVTSHESNVRCGWLAANLAIVFSQLGERTLLIDTNLRAPQQHRLFKLDNRVGLADVLASRARLDCAQRIGHLLDLSVLTAGTPVPNPQELLGRAQFGELLEEAAQRYDVVVVGTAPMHNAADAQIVAARAGGVLLLAESGKTAMVPLMRCRDELVAAGARILGCVLDMGEGA